MVAGIFLMIINVLVLYISRNIKVKCCENTNNLNLQLLMEKL